MVVLTTSTPIQDLTSTMTTKFTEIVSDMMSGIGSILPVVLPVVGGIAVIFLGVRLFKKLSKG